MSAPHGDSSALTPVTALGFIIQQITLHGREGGRYLLDEYRDRGALHVRRNGTFVRIEIVVTHVERPHWWIDEEGEPAT